MDDKERLVQLKYNMAFASSQRELQEKRRQLVAQLTAQGMQQSSRLVREITKFELESLSVLLDSRLEALLDAYYKGSVPWTDQDKAFLQTRIEDLFNARLRASRQSLIDYFAQRRLDPNVKDFEREANAILSSLMSQIEIKVLENRISYPRLPDLNVEHLLKMDESNQLEFKSTFQWDIKTQARNKDLRFKIVSTLAAFNNTDGGYLLIGVQDDKSIFGLERDYSLLKDKQDWDGFCLSLTQEIGNRISQGLVAKLKISQHNIENKDICFIKTDIGDDALWLKENNKEIFYIRTQNSTRALSARDSAEYIRRKWRPKD